MRVRHGVCIRTAGAVLALVLCAAPAFAGRDCPAPADFPNPELLASLKRGVNLPGWDSEDIARRATFKQLQALRQRGFDHVRLPLDNRRLSGSDSAAYLDAMVEQVVFLLSLDLAVVLDLHPDGTVGELFARNPDEAEAYLTEIWSSVAARIRSFDPRRVAIELLNEPQAGQDVWVGTAAKLIAGLRRTLPGTTVVLGPAGPQRHETLGDMQPLDDPNIVYAVHYYDPFSFTHQGAGWGGESDPVRFLRDLPWPASADDPGIRKAIEALKSAGHERSAEALASSLETPWTAATIDAAFDTMQGWSERSGRPVVVNEFGVLAFVSPRGSRLNWLSAVREAAEERCIGWTHWDFQDGFGLMGAETGMPDEGVMEALVPEGD